MDNERFLALVFWICVIGAGVVTVKEAIKAKADQWLGNFEAFAARHPLPVVGTSFALGFVFGLLT